MTRSLLIIGPEPDPAILEGLRSRGVEVDRGDQGTLDVLRSAPPAAALIDWDLDVGSGGGLCARIKRDRRLAGVFVVLTGRDPEILRAHAEGSQFRADAYLPRPFTIEALTQTLGSTVFVEDEPPEVDEDGIEDAGVGAPEPLETGGERDAWDELEARARDLESPVEADSQPPRASPEDRIQRLRRHGQALEARLSAFRELVADLLAAGRRARRDLEWARHRESEWARTVEAERAETSRVRRSFETYEAEVHRATQAKRDEERRSAEALAAARERVTELESARGHDAERLRILQSELAELDETARTEAARANAAWSELERLRKELDAKRAELRGLSARLAASDTLVDEMYEEIVSLRASERRSERWTELLDELESTLSVGLSPPRLR